MDVLVVPSQPVGGQDGPAREEALLLEDSLRAHYEPTARAATVG